VTSVTTSTQGAAGVVTITEGPATVPAPAQYSFLGYQVAISVPDGTVAAPLSITFSLDESLLQPAGLDYLTLQVARNGVPLPSCSVAPMPCVSQRSPLVAGPPPQGASITVQTVAASQWNFGKHAPYSVGPFLPPVAAAPAVNKVKAGSQVPVKFSLHGAQGLAILADTYPRSMTCGATTAGSSTTGTLTYDAKTDAYTYSWKTDKAWTGCRQLVLRFIDGTTRAALFQF
jgi:hypothetical protein